VTPAARLQAAIEILDRVAASARENGPPADAIVSRYFKDRRYAGSGDRRAVRDLVFRAIRRTADLPASGRAAMLGLAQDDPPLLDLFGEPRGPEPLAEGDEPAPASVIPAWLVPRLSSLVAREEWPALLERAPLDLRVNAARTSRGEVLAQLDGAAETPHSPWGLRLPPDTPIEQHPAYAAGLVEVQDEGSQMVAVACAPCAGQRILDLCAGAGGKTLALAAAAPGAEIIATDANKRRLAQLAPRAERAGVAVQTRLLDPPRELEQLDDIRGGCDTVLVDAPCSGSGTWRRNPEGRWRLTPQRLDQLASAQARLLDLGAELVRPGGTLVYAVCSIVAREGSTQVDAFLQRRSSWVALETGIGVGRSDGAGRLLTPGHDATDGFFVARLQRPC
jgi:16S rRNA (cytosine967-C5)-methyltransferase